MSIIKVGIVQQQCTTDQADNITKSLAGISVCAEAGARLVVLQELHTSLYFCQTESIPNYDLAVPIPGALTDRFAKAAQEHEIVIVASFYEKRAPGLYHNTAVVFEKDGSIAGIYRKMHIPDDPGYYEKFYFAPGDTGFKPIETSVGKLGVLVCWDQWFPEAARIMALNGAGILIYPTAIGWDYNDSMKEQKIQLDAWKTILRSHAIANGLPLVAVNRVGHESDPTNHTKGIQFWGNSLIVAANGEIRYEASTVEEAVTFIEIDTDQSEQTRRVWPFLRDRRIDAYGEVLMRFVDK